MNGLSDKSPWSFLCMSGISTIEYLFQDVPYSETPYVKDGDALLSAFASTTDHFLSDIFFLYNERT